MLPTTDRRLRQLCLAVPVGMATVSLVAELNAGRPNVGSAFFAFFYPLLIYAAPHAVWWGLTSSMQARPGTRLAGLCVASAALLAITALATWGPRDPSGMPYTWLLYWPLCVAGLSAVALIAWTQQRIARRG